MKKIITLKDLFIQADDLEKIAKEKNTGMIFTVNDRGVEIYFYDRPYQDLIYNDKQEWGNLLSERDCIATRIDKINALFKNAGAFIKNYTKKVAIEKELATLEKRSAELRKKLQEDVL